mgnify:CR=1 FL=1
MKKSRKKDIKETNTEIKDIKSENNSTEEKKLVVKFHDISTLKKSVPIELNNFTSLSMNNGTEEIWFSVYPGKKLIEFTVYPETYQFTLTQFKKLLESTKKKRNNPMI